MLALLAGLKAAGKTVFLSSHILPEVEQICDRVVILDRGRLVRAGRLDDMLAGVGRVEIEVDQLPEEIEAAWAARGVAAERAAAGIRLTAPDALKRELAESLWSAGCDVIRVNPVKSTLQDLFLKLVEDYEGAQ